MHTRHLVRIPTRRGSGSQKFMGAARYQRYGCPDFDVRTSRFEDSTDPLSPKPPSIGSSAKKAFEAALKAPRWLGEVLASRLDGDPLSPEPTKYGADRRS